MKSHIVKTLSLGLVAAALTIVPTISHAQDASTNAPAIPTKKHSTYVPFNGAVKAVDAKAETLTVGKLTFSVTAATKISYTTNNAPAKLADITVGETVSGSYSKDAEGKLTAHSVHIGAKGKAVTKPAKKKKAASTDNSTNSASN